MPSVPDRAPPPTTPSTPHLDEWRDAAVAKFAQRLSLHRGTFAKMASATTTTATLAAQPAPLRSLASAANRRPTTATTTSEKARRAEPTVQLRTSVHDLTLAARRAGAEAAAARRRRTEALAEKLAGPLRRAALREWRQRIETSLSYTAVVHYREVAMTAAIDSWLEASAAAHRLTRWCWLRKWRVALRVANARFDREDALAAKTRRKALWKAMRKLASRVATRKLSLAAAEEGRVRAVWHRLSTWHRVAAARAFAFRSVRLRGALRRLEKRALLAAPKPAACRARMALRAWQRETTRAHRATRLRSAFASLRSRAASAAESASLARTLRFAAAWHADRSSLQHALAQMLLYGWRQKRDCETMADATIIGVAASLGGALKRWRSHSILYGGRRATAETLRRLTPPRLPPSVRVTVEDEATEGARGHTDDAQRHVAAGGGGGGGGGGGDRTAAYLLHAAELALNSPSCPPPRSRFRVPHLHHQRQPQHAEPPPASTQLPPSRRAPPPAPPREDRASEALLDALVWKSTGVGLPGARTAAHTATAVAAAPDATTRGPPAAVPPPLLETHSAAASYAGAEDVAIAVGRGASRAHAEKQAEAMAGLRQKLSLGVPRPSYLALPPAKREQGRYGIDED